jgi:hypothetical protein
MYLGAALGVIVAISLVARGEPAPASVIAAGAAFLIYWAWRQSRERGER